MIDNNKIKMYEELDKVERKKQLADIKEFDAIMSDINKRNKQAPPTITKVKKLEKTCPTCNHPKSTHTKDGYMMFRGRLIRSEDCCKNCECVHFGNYQKADIRKEVKSHIEKFKLESEILSLQIGVRETIIRQMEDFLDREGYN